MIDQGIEAASRNVELDNVARLSQRQRASDCSFRSDMQHDSAIVGSRHSRIRYPHHIPHTTVEELAGNRNRTHLRHARKTAWATMSENQHVLGIDLQRGGFDARFEILQRVEY